MSALPKHMYGDPVLHVKFEHERNPCLKCKYLDMLWGKQVCVMGQKVGNGCLKFMARGAA